MLNPETVQIPEPLLQPGEAAQQLIRNTMVRFYDSHNHLQSERLSPHWGQLRASLDQAQVAGMVVNGTREEDWPRVRELAKWPGVIPSYGLHPWHVSARSPGWKAELLQQLNDGPAAVGEIGLDRWIENPHFEEQQEVFRWQWRLAADRKLPVSVHCLRAWGALYDFIRDEPRHPAGFLLHSYGGPAEMIGPLAKLGAYFSMSGYFAHESKARQLEHFRLVPPDRLLIETDAPDMLPPETLISHPLSDATGQPLNHPANSIAVYEFAARFLEKPLDEFAPQIEENFRRLFGIVASV